jgi:hypothetical protein
MRIPEVPFELMVLQMRSLSKLFAQMPSTVVQFDRCNLSICTYSIGIVSRSIALGASLRHTSRLDVFLHGGCE